MYKNRISNILCKTKKQLYYEIKKYNLHFVPTHGK